MSYTPVNPYCSLAELVGELRQRASDFPAGGEKEAELLRAIDRASRWVDDYTGRDYFFHDHSITPLLFDEFSGGVYGAEIFLPYKPVISILEFRVGSDVWVENSDYVTGRGDREGRIHGRRGNFAPTVETTITIRGSFGYRQSVSSQIPEMLPAKIATSTRLVAAAFSGLWRREEVGLDGAKQTITDTTIPQTVYQMLGKRMPVLV